MNHRRPIFSCASVLTAFIVGFLFLDMLPHLSWSGDAGIGSFLSVLILLALGLFVGEGFAITSFMRFERYTSLTLAAFILNALPLVYCLGSLLLGGRHA